MFSDELTMFIDFEFFEILIHFWERRNRAGTFVASSMNEKSGDLKVHYSR